MIHDYLDGELDQLNQDILFSELALNQDLRTEFNKQVKLQVVTQSDMATITPPIEATNAVFASLGFSIPSQEYMKNLTANTLAEGPFSAIKKFWAKHIALNSVLLLILLMTGSYVVFQPVIFNGSKNSGADRTGNSVFSNVNHADKFSAMSSSVPLISSYENKNSGTVLSGSDIASNNSESVTNNYRNSRQVNFRDNSAFESNSYYLHNDESRLNNVSGDMIESGNNLDLFSLLSGSNQDLRLNDLVNKRMNSFLAFNSNAYVNPSQSLNNNYYIWGLPQYRFRHQSPEVSIDITKWMLQVRTLNLNQAQQVSLSNSFDKPAQNKWYDNLSFTALYKFNSYHSLGIECGWEPFNQVFYNNENGQTYRQQQSPTLFWIGAAYRFTYPDIGWQNVIYPYAQIVAGGTTVGPLGRGQIGIQIEPVSLIRFDLGLEAACLIYRLQGTTYAPFKYGLTFGGGINF